jgi:hypothetical protein
MESGVNPRRAGRARALRRSCVFFLALAGGTVWGAAVGRADQAGSAFTYQGRLIKDGTPVSGICSTIIFRLYDVPTGGSQITAVSYLGVPISEDGLFTVNVDFGPGAFNGQPRWLELNVACPPDDILTPLEGRQPVTPAPYAIKSPGVSAAAGSPADAVSIDSAGNVGIGTAVPNYPLHVKAGSGSGIKIQHNGAGNFPQLRWTNAVDTLLAAISVDSSNPDMRFYVDGADRMVVDSAGNVGIGTMSAASELHVKRTAAGDQSVITVESGPGAYAAIDFKESGETFWGMGKDNNAAFYIESQSAGFFTRRLTIRGDSGNLGIGVADPTHTLDVNGAIRIRGGSDVAEPFNVHGVDVRPGMVVVIDAERVGEMRVADRPYDSAVAGVISGANGVQPGLMLHQEGTKADGQYPVALSGRVYCYADADANGTIRPGDMLTTSGTPGHAMRVGPKDEAPPGAILGKAMSSLENGRGLVLVLVNLQ